MTGARSPHAGGGRHCRGRSKVKGVQTVNSQPLGVDKYGNILTWVELQIFHATTHFSLF
jgi:hypothetical protein